MALFLFANAYLLYRLGVVRSPLAVAAGWLLELLLLVFFVHWLFHHLETSLRILWSIMVSAAEGIASNRYVARLTSRYPRAFKWLGDRFTTKEPTGIVLTLGVIFSLVFLVLFLGIIEDVVLNEPLTNVDQRIANLVPSIRTPDQTWFFSVVTFCANGQTILLLSLAVLAFLLIKKSHFIALVFCTAVVGESAIGGAIKYLVGRPRPNPAMSLLTEGSYSFPSGHTLSAVVVFGLVTYLAVRSLKSHMAAVPVILGYILVVFLVAMSRVYLGVHFLSDVLASILLGSFLLIAIITLLEINFRYRVFERYSLFTHSPSPYSNRPLLLLPLLVLAFSLAFHSWFIHAHPVEVKPPSIVIAALDEATIQGLPKHAETLTGRQADPVSFCYVGSEQEIMDLFTSHGWYRADRATPKNDLRTFWTVFSNEQYLNAPVTPSYIDGKPEDLAFERPTGSNTLRQRHHTRLWETPFVLPGARRVWVGTASLDEGIELSHTVFLPTHRVDPNVDAERQFIAESLGLKNPEYLQVNGPEMGKNAGGDPYFTDGRAVVVYLGGQAP